MSHLFSNNHIIEPFLFLFIIYIYWISCFEVIVHTRDDSTNIGMVVVVSVTVESGEGRVSLDEGLVVGLFLDTVGSVMAEDGSG
jgi:hypothetical protein